MTSLTLGSILLGGALVVVVVLYLVRPLLDPDTAADFTDMEEIELLQARKFALLKKIQELDDDLEQGKVAQELYNFDRPRLVKQTALVMQQIDALEAHEAAARGVVPAAAVDQAAIDAQIEAAVRQRRSPAQIDDDIEAAIRKRRAAANGVTPAAPAKPAAQAEPAARPRFCPQCGQPVETTDRFCAACGHNLAGEPSQASVAASG